MGGEWTFEFIYKEKESLKVKKYQELLLKIKEEFEPQFAEMSTVECEVEWTTTTNGRAPKDNMFARFTYKCVKPHAGKGDEHGTWYLLWNPKKADIKSELHARCAPTKFKEVSNQVQRKLAKEFPKHFRVKWENGISGYAAFSSLGGDSGLGGGGGHGHGFGGNRRTDWRAVQQFCQAMARMNVGGGGDDSDGSDDHCPHHYPWGHCQRCG